MSNTGSKQNRDLKYTATQDGILYEWDGAQFLVNSKKYSPGQYLYQVALQEGDWPSKSDLLAICDGSHPDNPSHYGGECHSEGERIKTVVVYID